jgi:hypothetical protein
VSIFKRQRLTVQRNIKRSAAHSTDRQTKIDVFCTTTTPVVVLAVDAQTTMPPLIHTFSDEINYLVWRYLRESSILQCVWDWTYCVDLAQTAWTLEAEIKSKSGKDVVALHEEVGKNIPLDLSKRLRMSMQYQEVLKHMSDVSSFLESLTV